MGKNVMIEVNNGNLIEEEHDEFIEDAEKKISLQDALEITQHGKFHLIVLLITGCSLMANVLENVNISLILPQVKCDLEMTTTQQGILNSIGFLGILISSYFWGFLADTWSRKNVMKSALMGGFIFSILSAFSTSATMLIVLRFMVGLMISGVQAAVFSYISEFHTKETGPRATSFIAMFMPAVFCVLPIFGWIIIPIKWDFSILGIKFSSWRLYIICSSLLNVMNFVALNFLPETPTFLLSMNKKEEALATLRTMYAINTGNPKEMYPVKDLIIEEIGSSISDARGISDILKLVLDQIWPLFVKPYVDKTLKLSLLMFILFSIGNGTFLWFPDFVSQLQNYNSTDSTLCDIVGYKQIVSVEIDLSVSRSCNVDNSNPMIFYVLFIVGIIFTTLSGLISFFIDKIGKTLLMSSWLFLSAMACISLIWQQQTYIIMICFVIFTSCSSCASILTALSVVMFPTNVRAMATCMILMFARIGSFAGSNLVGLLLENECNAIFSIYGTLLIGAIFIFWWLVRKPQDTMQKFIIVENNNAQKRQLI